MHFLTGKSIFSYLFRSLTHLPEEGRRGSRRIHCDAVIRHLLQERCCLLGLNVQAEIVTDWPAGRELPSRPPRAQGRRPGGASAAPQALLQRFSRFLSLWRHCCVRSLLTGGQLALSTILSIHWPPSLPSPGLLRVRNTSRVQQK